MRNIKGIICILLVSVFLAGCGNPASSTNTETMTANEFKKSMENKGFTVVDQTSSAADSTYQKIYVAVDEKKYSFEYYFMKNDDSADVVYQYAVSGLTNAYADKNATISEDEKDNSKRYYVDASDYYCVVLKKENTVLYVTAYHDYEKEAKNIVKELGYK